MEKISLKRIYELPIGTKVLIKDFGSFYFFEKNDYDIEFFDGFRFRYITDFLEENDIEDETKIEVFLLEPADPKMVRTMLLSKLFIMFDDIGIYDKVEIENLIKKIEITNRILQGTK